MKAAELFVQCLENEGVEFIFGLPGEENIDVLDALKGSSIKFITVRHEQGAAFMAGVYGRLTGRPGVCLSTLGPGATNLITGFADANMDRAPIVAIAGQGDTTRMHKESHQMLDLVRLFEPVSKYAAEITHTDVIPEIVRKAFKVAQSEKPGGAFISFPENVAYSELANPKSPLRVQQAADSLPPTHKIDQAAQVITEASHPIVMAGNGVIRDGASSALVDFAEQLNIPVATTFMAKGAMPFSHRLSLGTVGLQDHDYVACGFDRADVIICVGFDLVEYPPAAWHGDQAKKLIHIDRTYAEVDEHYILEVGVVGDIAATLDAIALKGKSRSDTDMGSLREVILEEFAENDADTSFPMKPQRVLSDVRGVLNHKDILISDVGAHKLWIARMFQAEAPNTCLISNGFASMGIGLPGAIAAKLVHPERTILTITGDAGFLMNSQELETAMRLNLALVIMIWSDSQYGLIKWHQDKKFGRDAFIDFNNPDFIKFAESFGARGYRVNSADELVPVIEKAIADDTVVIIDVPIDYTENMKLTEKLGNLVCPI